MRWVVQQLAGVGDIVNATISGNEALNGAGIYNTEEGAMEITNATVFNNAATTGGGIFNETDGSVSVVNTIIAGNSATVVSSDLMGVFNSNGNNLIGDQAGSSASLMC